MNSLKQVPNILLNDGQSIPQLGFGVFQVPPLQTAEAVSEAIAAGYRHIDTAMSYANEKGVGEAVQNINDEVFVSTKYFNPDDATHGFRDAIAGFETSSKMLGQSKISLYLIHWPLSLNDRLVESWKGLVELKKSGRVPSVGVSNFEPLHLQKIIKETGVTPSVNQIELHPYFQQQTLRKIHAELGVVTEAWAPLGQGKVLQDPVLIDIGKKYGKSSAQIVLRWHIQLGNVAIPKSVKPERIRENFDIFDFELLPEDMMAIKQLDRGKRNGLDPNTYVFPKNYRISGHRIADENS